MTTQGQLEEAAGVYAEAQKRAEAARQALADLIVEAARAGMRQVDIVKATGYTRESVRKICRDAGVGEAPRSVD
jgi:hypothetical protein